MTKTDKYLERFDRYLHGEVSEEEARAFDLALEGDATMRKAWQEYKDMMAAFADKEMVSLRVKLNAVYDHYFGEPVVRQLFTNKWYKISAAVVVIIIIASLLYFGNQQDGEELAIQVPDIHIVDTTAVHADTAEMILPEMPEEPQIPKEKQLASLYDDERYQISPVYAELLHTVYRSGWFRLSSPPDSAIFAPDDSLVFAWETNITEPLYFDVLDRKGKVIYKHTGSINSPWTYKPQLPPAIYMFRFATENEPVWMGAGVAK